jgi:hypothetical protein
VESNAQAKQSSRAEANRAHSQAHHESLGAHERRPPADSQDFKEARMKPNLEHTRFPTGSRYVLRSGELVLLDIAMSTDGSRTDAVELICSAAFLEEMKNFFARDDLYRKIKERNLVLQSEPFRLPLRFSNREVI